MMDSPKVSVAIITYNQAAFIAQAIDSVLAQQVDFPIEILIGEDDSSDGTREIVSRYAAAHPEKIRAFFHDRHAPSPYRPAMRNFVHNLRAARGQYIALLEGDDFWTAPDKLQKQVALLDAHPEASVCFARADILLEDGRKQSGHGAVPHPQPRFTLADVLDRRLLARLCTVVYRRGLFPDIPDWFCRAPVGDLPLLVLNGLKGDFLFLDEYVATYRKHAGGMWSQGTASLAARAQRCATLVRLYELLRAHTPPAFAAIIDRHISTFAHGEAAAHRALGDWPALRSSLGRALRAAPFNPAIPLRQTLGALLVAACPWLTRLSRPSPQGSGE